MFAEKVIDFCLPPFCIGLSHLLCEQDEDDKDEESLEGHKDDEDECKGKKFINFYHQNPNDPG